MQPQSGPAGSGGNPPVPDPAPAANTQGGQSPSLTGADDSFGLGRDDSWSLSGELAAGVDVGGFTIIRLLATGGMGRVYEARQDAPRRTVAVKVIREGAVPSAAHERLLREAETLARLRHPHVAHIHTCGTAPAALGGMPFFVMELVDGARSITRFAAARALSIRGRVGLFRKVCDAVAHGHRQGVVHRDLKPANILVGSDGEPKVIDYGIAWEPQAALHEAASQPQGSAVDTTAAFGGRVVGTLRYMSPEQLLAPDRGPDARSDVYALGLVLHELVAGRLPYDLAEKSVAEAMRLLGSGAAPCTTIVERAASAEERRDDARALAVVVAKCLEPLPAERYGDAAELAADLDRWLAGRAIRARGHIALLRRPKGWCVKYAFRLRKCFLGFPGSVLAVLLCIARWPGTVGMGTVWLPPGSLSPDLGACGFSSALSADAKQLRLFVGSGTGAAGPRFDHTLAIGSWPGSPVVCIRTSHGPLARW